MTWTPFGYLVSEGDTTITCLDPAHTSHTILQDIGVATHAQIDTHIADYQSKVNQDVRTTAAPTFTTAVNVTQSGNTSFTIPTKMDLGYSNNNAAWYTSAVVGDINLRNIDSTKSLNLGVGSGTAQLKISNAIATSNVPLTVNANTIEPSILINNTHTA